jgi:hypothetical protein
MRTWDLANPDDQPAPNSTWRERDADRRAHGDDDLMAMPLHLGWSGELMTNMVVYLIGTLLVVAGLAYAATRLGVSQPWIIAGALVIIGLGLMGGIVKTRQKDPAP